ncbi:hypothetical protein [Xylella fastidiosa]|uniref:Uncharacterized protein n=1 Tax=Xylella fastidiosa subsp. sandyi Ann-1 TaxID=155920 RepID=A0A060H6V9_XYLFS|nr:hypothetical protein [Xylella fastidiosa]AIC11040.1 hypothetical protein D934_03315 [Xylella fastidiosa subsp. sandyi Ann-1]UIX81718.1 hypothetical protein LZ756_02240 [Xylella fastidiosa subsp. sandyi]
MNAIQSIRSNTIKERSIVRRTSPIGKKHTRKSNLMTKQATQQANYRAPFSKAKSIKDNEKHQFENNTPDTVIPSQKTNAGLNFSKTSVSNAKELKPYTEE